MRLRLVQRFALALGMSLAFVPAAHSDEELKPDKAVGLRLLSEGDALADDGKTNDAVLRYKTAFEHLLPGMRKLRFKHEVKRDVTARENMSTLLLKEIDEQITPAEFRANEMGMKVLGLLPRDINLKAVMVKLYSEEIAAFYDSKTKTMHLIKEPEKKNRRPPTVMERLFGKTDEFDKDQTKGTIAHELTHALADQNYNLDVLHKSVKQDDDRDLALSALVEGEAMLTMLGAQLNDWNGTQIQRVSASRLEFMFSLLRPLIPFSSGPSLREAPVILTESMIFPYFRGLVFCARLTNDDGWKALDDAYRQPPLSTEQILHPEKYRAKPDMPTAIDLGKLDAGEEWKELGRNVVGEMQLGVLLRVHGGKNAAAGWDGDRFAVFEGPKNALALVWFSTWDSESDAREFATGYARFQTTKMAPDTPKLDEVPARLARTSGDVTYLVERRGADVVVAEGFGKELTTKLVDAAFGAKKSEMTYPRPKEGAGK
jgi:hypothetical protein